MSSQRAKSALDDLKAARSGKQKRSKQHKMEQLEDVFDQVEEDDGARLAQQRQDRSFVVMDESDQPLNQEEWDDYDNDFDGRTAPVTKPKKKAGARGASNAKASGAAGKPATAAAAAAAGNGPRITSLFRGGAGGEAAGAAAGRAQSAAPKSLHQAGASTAASSVAGGTDDFLESALGDLSSALAPGSSGGSGSKKAKRKKKKTAAVGPAAPKTKKKRAKTAPADAMASSSAQSTSVSAATLLMEKQAASLAPKVPDLAPGSADQPKDTTDGNDEGKDDDDDDDEGDEDDDSLFVEVEVAVTDGDDEQAIAQRAANAAQSIDVDAALALKKKQQQLHQQQQQGGASIGLEKSATSHAQKKRKTPPAAAPADPNLQQPQWWSSGADDAGQVDVGAAVVDLAASDDAKAAMFFFWTDATEDQRNAPGTVFLFGKTTREQAQRAGALPVGGAGGGPQDLLSMCVVVRNVERTLFFAPRPGTDAMELYKEVEQIRRRLGIKSMRAKPVEREYYFDVPGVPHGPNQYLKVQYSASDPAWSQLSGRTFCHVFGANTSALEAFLIRRRIMGPCWLRLTLAADRVSAPPTRDRLSHCRAEVWCANMRDLVPLTEELLNPAAAADPPTGAPPARRVPMPRPPVLCVMSLIVRTIYNHASHANEIVAVAAVVHPRAFGDRPTERPEQAYFSFCAVRKLAGHALPPDFKALAARDKQQHASQRRGNIEICGSERALLSYVLAKVESLDPDVIVGHNFVGFTLDVILHRMKAHNITQWSKLGRLRRRKIPKLQSGAGGASDSTYGEKQIMAGRLVLDTYTTTKELLPRVKSYGLQDLSAQVLNMQRENLDFDQTAQYFTAGPTLMRFVRHAEMDAFFCLQLQFALQVLPLTMQLTNLAGNLWSRSLMGARAERIEYLLLHEFHARKHILPDREFTQQKKKSGAPRREKAKYAGGLVLEPKAGFYDDYVLLLDFNSLYPSIVQEHNICFTTVSRARDDDGDTAAAADEPADIDAVAATPPRATSMAIPLPAMTVRTSPDQEPVESLLAKERAERVRQAGLPWLPAEPPSEGTPRGVLPRVINTLLERRRAVKRLMKAERDSTKRELLNIRQLSLKLIANSMYGCLGFAHSRFCAQPLAELITRKGRETLQMTVDLATNKHHLDVIYGDTDSVMIRTKVPSSVSAGSGAESAPSAPQSGGPASPAQLQALKSVLDLGKQLKQSVNQRFKLLEIEIDGLFASLLLLKKKKYAALALKAPYTDPTQTVRETKGLDLVRRDWCDLSRRTGQQALDEILAGQSSDEVVAAIHGHLKVCGERVRANLVPLDDYVITKSLSKLPQDYPDSRSQPHVQVALKLQKMGRRVGVGDRVPYVICVGPSTMSVAERAHHPDQLSKHDEATAAAANAAVAEVSAAAGGAAPSSSSGEVKAAKSSDGAVTVAKDAGSQPPTAVPGQLCIDAQWYLTQQILPPISRLCEAIPGTSPAQLAHALGIDATKYRNEFGGGGGGGGIHGIDDDDDRPDLAARRSVDPKQKFRNVDPLLTACWRCGKSFSFQGIREAKVEAGGGDNEDDDNEVEVEQQDAANHAEQSPMDEAHEPKDRASAPNKRPARADAAVAAAKKPVARSGLIEAPCSGLHCPSCAEPINCVALANQLTQAIRACVRRYYDNWVVCSERTCARRTRQLSWRQRADEPDRACCILPFCDGKVRVEYNEAKLLTQLEYFRWCFDVQSEQKLRAEVAPEQHGPFIRQLSRADEDGISDADMFFSLRSLVDKELHRNARYTVNAKNLFSACV